MPSHVQAMIGQVRDQVLEIFHDQPEHRIIELRLLDAAGTEADLFVILAQFFCGGLSLMSGLDLEADVTRVASKLRQCGVSCDIQECEGSSHFAAFASYDVMLGDTMFPARFPIVRKHDNAETHSYFPSDSPGAYTPRRSKYFYIDRAKDADVSRYFVPIEEQDALYAGVAPHIDIPPVSCSSHPYAVSSATTYPVIVCNCTERAVRLYSGQYSCQVRFVPEINIGFTGGTYRCHGPRLAA